VSVREYFVSIRCQKSARGVITYHAVIASIYSLIKVLSLFGSLTLSIILTKFCEQVKRYIGLDMANSDASSSTACTVRVLTSFYLVATNDSSSTRTSPIHKKKFNVLLSGDKHKDLSNFVKHLKTFTGLAEIAKGKGLGENPEVTIARVQKLQKAGSGVETFSLRTQDAWKYEFEEKKRVFNCLNERFGSNRTGDMIFSTRSFRTLHTKMNISQ